FTAWRCGWDARAKHVFRNKRPGISQNRLFNFFQACLVNSKVPGNLLETVLQVLSTFLHDIPVTLRTIDNSALCLAKRSGKSGPFRRPPADDLRLGAGAQVLGFIWQGHDKNITVDCPWRWFSCKLHKSHVVIQELMNVTGVSMNGPDRDS